MEKNTVFITGASSGIGKAAALLFQRKGWNVAAGMRRPEKETELSKLENIKCFYMDVTDPDSTGMAIKSAIAAFGGINVLVNNAAYNLTGPFEGATPDQIKDLYEVDVFGLMNVTREILPHFRALNKGVIVNISSLGGLIGMPLSSFYASAKWAVEGFSESIRFELDKLGIKVRVVEPGAVKTNFAMNTIIVRKRDVPSYEETIEKRLAAYAARRNKLSDPMVIAKVIFQAATDKSSRLRYLAGGDAKLFWILRTAMPFKLFTLLLRKLAG